MTLLNKLRVFAEAIKFEHSVFALPFALGSLLLAAGGWPGARIALLVVLAAVAARTAAMAFNRWADAEIDARNPRTATRAVPAGLLSARFMLAAALLSAAVFVGAAAALNLLALALSPLALAVLLGYSYAKRLTPAAHFVLGLALGIAPVGAAVAACGKITPLSMIISAGVICWVAAFDIMYATQDAEFDRREGLHSVPARLSPGRVIALTAALLAAAWALLAAVAVVAAGSRGGALLPGSWPYAAALAIIGFLFYWMHAMFRRSRPDDRRGIDLAFFRINLWVPIVWLLGVLGQLALGQWSRP